MCIRDRGKDVADCAAVLDLISGHDPKDSTSLLRRADEGAGSFSDARKEDVKGMRIGIPKDYVG